MSEKNTGELANEILSDLTRVEEFLETVSTEHISEHRLHELNFAKGGLRDAQENASEILRRYEEEHGPI